MAEKQLLAPHSYMLDAGFDPKSRKRYSFTKSGNDFSPTPQLARCLSSVRVSVFGPAAFRSEMEGILRMAGAIPSAFDSSVYCILSSHHEAPPAAVRAAGRELSLMAPQVVLEAQQHKIHIVDKEWLRQCVWEQTRVDPSRFVIPLLTHGVKVQLLAGDRFALRGEHVLEYCCC